jgi:hypothetical protein
VTLSLHVLASTANAQKRKSASPRAKAAQAEPVRVKVAEGTYQLKKVDGTTSASFEEPWTLFKTNLGFDLEEQWVVNKDPQSAPMIVDILVNFAPGLYPIQFRVGGSGSSKELRCATAIKEFTCESAGLQSKLPMIGSYNLFLPSPWMLSSIARRAKKVPDQSTSVQLVQMVGMSDAGPKLDSFQAEVQYVGEDEVAVDSTKLPASIFELKAKIIPSMLIWVSTEGLVLALQDSSKPEQRMELVKYVKYAKF